MPRQRRPLIFKQNDVRRLLRAYEAAGAAQPTVRITKAGDLIAEPPKDSGVMSEEEPTPLEQWRAERRGQG